MNPRQRIKIALAALLVALTISIAAIAAGSFTQASVAMAAPCWRCGESLEYQQ